METTVPAYSIFSATSELFVTAGVLYSIIANLKGRPFPWKVLGLVVAFEGIVNVVYMARMAGRADKSSELSQMAKLIFAGHGMLSLLMYLALAVCFVLAVKDVKDGRETWFVRHRMGSWTLVFFWMVSIISGEAIFLWRYGGALFG